MGEGGYRRELEGLAKRLGIQAKFVGSVDYSEVPKYLCVSDLFVLPSHWEIQPLTCLEAMACGIPVIATDVGGVPEIVADGHNGALVPPRKPSLLARKIKQLKEDEDSRQRFVKNGLKFIEERTWEKIAKQTENVYEDLLK